MFILEMQACRFAAEELTPKLHHGSSSQSEQESCAHLGCPTQVILKRADQIPLGCHFNPSLGMQEWSAPGGNSEAMR